MLLSKALGRILDTRSIAFSAAADGDGFEFQPRPVPKCDGGVVAARSISA